MNDWIQTILGKRMADALASAGNEIADYFARKEKRKQYTVSCATDDVGEELTKNIESGANLVQIWEHEGLAVIVFEA